MAETKHSFSPKRKSAPLSGLNHSSVVRAVHHKFDWLSDRVVSVVYLISDSLVVYQRW